MLPFLLLTAGSPLPPRQRGRVRGRLLEGDHAGQGLCQRARAHLLRPARHQEGGSDEGAGVLHGLRQHLLPQPDPHLQPTKTGKSGNILLPTYMLKKYVFGTIVCLTMYVASLKQWGITDMPSVYF